MSLHLAIQLLIANAAIAQGFHDNKIGNKTYPGWHEFRYFSPAALQNNSFVRTHVLTEFSPKSFLMCPKGHVIEKIRASFFRHDDELTEGHEWTPAIIYAIPDTDPAAEHSSKEGCISLKECLGFQACVFTFGNEFCKCDSNPGQRKVLMANISCTSEEWLLRSFSSLATFFEKRFDRVAHLTYDSKLNQLGVEPSSIALNETKIEVQLRQEEKVFAATCPQDPYKSGYKGECRPLLNKTSEEISEGVWHIMSRIESETCQNRLMEVHCAFLYNSKGLCIPPGFLNGSGANSMLGTELYPLRGARPTPVPNLEQHELIPAVMGFSLLVHSGSLSVMQLLESIYRPQNYYVIHVDQRKDHIRYEIVDLIRERFGSALNVRVLPKHRSFVTSWGSFGLVRAQLETYEELCRLGIWDFAINLSGADLPLRSLTDLSYALAPHRNESFISYHGIGYKNAPFQMDEHAMKGLLLDSYYTCNGFTFNVTRNGGVPQMADIKMASASQWSVLARQLVEDLLDQEKHSPAWKKHNFWMATTCIPDESYIPTFAINSGHKIHNLGLHFLKSFNDHDAYQLCRHLSDADFCGQGPGFLDDGDLQNLIDYSHLFFFARKFKTDDDALESVPRPQVLDLGIGGRYYTNLRRFLPESLLQQLMMEAIGKKYGNGANLSFTLNQLRIVPRLQPRDPCCQYPFDRRFHSVQEYQYIFEFEAFSEVNGSVLGAFRAKFSYRAPFKCYKFGHLRVLRVTALSREHHHEDSMVRSPVPLNMPFNFFPSGVPTVYVEVWLNTYNELLKTHGCQNPSKSNHEDEHMVFIDQLRPFNSSEPRYLNAGSSMLIRADLIDPMGNIRASGDKLIEWNNETVKHFFDPRDGRNRSFHGELAHTFTLNTGSTEPGIWTVRVYKAQGTKPFIYEIPLLFLPPRAIIDSTEENLLLGFWNVESVTNVNSVKSFTTQNVAFATAQEAKHGCDVDCQSCSGKGYNPTTIMYINEWLFCGGGLVTLITCFYFTLSSFNGLTARSSINRRSSAFRTLTVVSLAILFQAIICTISELCF